MKNSFRTSVAGWILFALVLCFLGTLFLPYFAYGDAGESASLMGYLSFPYNYGELETWIGTHIDGYGINTLANAHVALFLGVLVAGILLVALRDNPISMAVAGGVGIWGVVTYAVNPVLALGGAMRTVHIALLAAIAILGVVSVVFWAVREREETVAQKATPIGGEARAHG